MGDPLIRQVSYQSPFRASTMPFLMRYYRCAFRPEYRSSADVLLSRLLRRLFVHYRRLCRQPCWGTLEYTRLGATHAVRCDVRNLGFHSVFGWSIEYGYQQDTAMLVDALLPEAGTFYDVGSNWGHFALYAASRRRELVVHAFEPHPLTFRDLKSSVEQAGLKDVVTCHNVAASNADGEAFIRIPDQMHSGQAEVSRSGGTRILTRRLDSLGLTPPDLIKLDVEGHELEALRGAESTLRQAQPFLVLESKRDYEAPERTLAPLFYLANHGYRLFHTALERNQGPNRFLVPFYSQTRQGSMQFVATNDRLALAELRPAERFFLQTDLDLLACHEGRMEKLRAAFCAPG